ncbi:MAG TPA: phosphotransferase [Rhodanobacteraceae bacterium]|nr:phosphotransferase [Rhodanobacteraceae bacterium]
MSAATHRVHGLAGDEIAPDWPPLQITGVERLLDGFPALRGPVSILWHSPRPLSAAARVLTPGGEVFVKRHHPRVRSPAVLAQEHALMAHLRARGMPIPAVLADHAGHSAIEQAGWTWEVHALAEGEDRFRDAMSWQPLTDAAQAQAAGRMLARLHDAAADYHAPQRETHVLVSRADLLLASDLGDTLEGQWPERPALAAFLQRRDWRRELAPIVARQSRLRDALAAESPLWTHNDWHVSNLFWDAAKPDAIRAVLDFGLSARTFALYDLATAIERNAIAWLELGQTEAIGHPAIAAALIDGYHGIRPLDARRRALLADVLPIVQLDFALSEIEYYQGITHSTAHADVAWHDFLLGHAAWFDSVPGKALEDTIRRGRA